MRMFPPSELTYVRTRKCGQCFRSQLDDGDGCGSRGLKVQADVGCGGEI